MPFTQKCTQSDPEQYREGDEHLFIFFSADAIPDKSSWSNDLFYLSWLVQRFVITDRLELVEKYANSLKGFQLFTLNLWRRVSG